MKRISIEDFVQGQKQIKFYGRRVGYCSRPGLPLSFLTDAKNQCGLTPEEKTEVIAYAIGELGHIRKTPQTEPFWPKKEPEHGNEGIDD